jgi:hypothetical protein
MLRRSCLTSFDGLQQPIRTADEVVPRHRNRAGFNAAGIFRDEAAIAMIAANAATKILNPNFDSPAASRALLQEIRARRHVASPFVRRRDRCEIPGRQETS